MTSILVEKNMEWIVNNYKYQLIDLGENIIAYMLGP
jgi:hypothetical protein